MSRLFYSGLLAVALVAGGSGVKAQENGASDPEEELQQTNFRVGDTNFEVPNAFAASALGIEDSAITRPLSPASLGVGLLSGVDAAGNFQSGFAIEMVPYNLFAGQDLTFAKYRYGCDPSDTNLPCDLESRSKSEGFWNRVPTRIALSTALTRGANNDDESARLAAGLSWTVFDAGDPKLDDRLESCLLNLNTPFLTAIQIAALREQVESEGLDPKSTGGFAKFVELEEAARQSKIDSMPELETAAETCRKESRKRNWNRSRMNIGFAPVFFSEDGEIDDLGYESTLASVEVSYGFSNFTALSDSAQLVLGLSYADDEKFARDNGKFGARDRFEVAGRIIYGDPNRYLFGAEIAYMDLSVEDGKSSTETKYGVAIDWKIDEQLWLSLSTGSSTEDDNNEQFAFARIRWEFIDNSPIAALRERTN